jgi:hypothetical protein
MLTFCFAVFSKGKPRFREIARSNVDWVYLRSFFFTRDYFFRPIQRNKCELTNEKSPTVERMLRCGMIETSRRSVISLIVAAPAIIRAGSLMPVRNMLDGVSYHDAMTCPQCAYLRQLHRNYQGADAGARPVQAWGH